MKRVEAKSAAGGRGRLWEVDAARGVAILMMAVYHTVFDLYAYGGYEIDAVGGGWARFADLTAGSFLFLVGASLAISAERDFLREGETRFVRYLQRGLKVFAFGMLLTVVFLAFGMGYVVFGILHLIGVSVVLAYPLLRYRALNLVLGAGVFALGLYVLRLTDTGLQPDSPWLLPLGFAPENLYMPDYRPLLPWFGVVLLGLGLGNFVYGRGGRLVRRAAPRATAPLTFLGRHSLLVYLVHQPIILALLAVTGIISL